MVDRKQDRNRDEVDSKVDSKVNASCNTDDNNNKTTFDARPQLNYLRSAWSTTDLYYHQSSFNSKTSSSDEVDENFYKIKLSPIQLQDCDDDEEEPTDEVYVELFRMITIANILCIVSSLTSLGLVLYSMQPNWRNFFWQYDEWMPHAILPFYVLWWIFMMRVLRKNRRTENLVQYLNWTQAGAIIMTITNLVFSRPQFNYLFASLSIIAFAIYLFAKRMWLANEHRSERLKKRVLQESKKLQDFVDQHTDDFGNHRLAFLATVSQEIQDVALMVITTLEQFSPASILTNTHELLSACSMAVPIASISAINTTIRQVCHVSSHLELLQKLTVQAWTRSNANLLPLPDLILAEFDIGELLQNVGDALAGVAAKLDVTFVIYHCDNILHHVLVLGDEGAIRHALLNHLRNILECCTPGACIEVGLNVVQVRDPKYRKITFHITHTSSLSIQNASAALLPNANLTAQLLSYISASCTVDVENNKNQTKFEFSFELECGKKENTNKMFISHNSNLLKNHYANIKFSNEPSLRDLGKFVEGLKGLKMVLHAPAQSIFAKHLTSFLASWNTDISHVPVENHPTMDAKESGPASSSSSVGGGDASDHSNVTTPNQSVETPLPTPRAPTASPVPSPVIAEEHIHSIPPTFILIDDDIPTLESKLNEFRSQPAAPAHVLQAHHQIGRRSHLQQQHVKKPPNSPTTAGATAGHQNFFHQGTTAFIHFTSLANYKAVRDTIQCYAFLPSRDPFSMPRVVVVPKPAGVRRFLTALHTAWHNSVVEPHFSAIATSPSSPMPPFLSMLVQREMASVAGSSANNSNATSPNEQRVSPGSINAHHQNNENVSPGSIATPRRSRPLSGGFTSSPTGDNYFTSQQQQLQQQSTATSVSKRRSANSDILQQQDYLTAKTVLMPAKDSMTGVVSTPAIVAASVAAAAAQEQQLLQQQQQQQNEHNTIKEAGMAHDQIVSSTTIASAVDDLIAETDTNPSSTESVPVVSPLLVTGGGTQPQVSSTLAVDTTSPVQKKPMSKSMTNFKLQKRKRKAKGNAFENSVSPPINVLIVEDNIINQAILSAWMKKHKIKFSVASNGSEAVEKWKAGGFHLVLMDIQLPVMDGIEATKLIRSIEKEQKIGVLPMSSAFLRHQQAIAAATAATILNNNNSNEENPPPSEFELETVAAEMLAISNAAAENEEKPSIFRSPVIIVALTASSLESDRHAALAAGCNDFLTKPVSLEWLEKKIIEWGCMQALIDFEGWRRWKKKSNTTTADLDQATKTKLALYTSTSNTTTTSTTGLTKEEEEAEKKRIEDLSKIPNKSGILLPGASNLIKMKQSNSGRGDEMKRKNSSKAGQHKLG